MKTYAILAGLLLVFNGAVASDSPISLSCPWMAADVFGVGDKCEGSYNDEGAHTGVSYYAVDFNLWLNNGCASDMGYPILAMADGAVTLSGWNGGFGNTVILNHGVVDEKVVKSLYAHFTTTCVRVGEDVQRGQVVGFLGTTGRSTGPHLHAEVRHGGQSVRMTPMDGQTMTNNMALLSHNTGVFDREYAANGGAGTFGSLANPGNTYAGVHWYNDYNAANLYRVQGVPNNCCAQDYQGGLPVDNPC